MRNQLTNRRYDLDWLRIILICTVFLYHLGMIFNGWGWHIKSDEPIVVIHPLMDFLHLWRMPLLFLISGAGTFFALGKKNIIQFVKERYQRLIIPLLFGVLVIVPPQVFIEKIDQYQGFLDFYPHIFSGIYPEGNFSWHHMWFIAYLFCLTLLSVPVIIILNGVKGKLFLNALDVLLSKPGGFLLLVIPLFISESLLRPYFPDETHALIDDWAYFFFNFIFFTYGYIFMANANLSLYLCRQRRLHFGLAILVTFTIYLTPFSLPHELHQFSRILISWLWPLTILGYGRKYLNYHHKWLPVLNEGIYPFYILHQTIIVIAAYFILQLEISLLTKFLLILVSSLLVILTVYWGLIRPFNFMRLVFGLKMLRKESKERESVKNTPEKIDLSTLIVTGIVVKKLNQQKIRK